MIENNLMPKVDSAHAPYERSESQGEPCTTSHRKLKKIVLDFASDAPSQSEIDEKIRNMKKTFLIQSKEETEATDMPKTIRETKMCSTQTELNPILQTHENSYRKDIIPASRLSSKKLPKLSRMDQTNKVDKSHSFKQTFKPNQFKYEQLQRDKSKHPLKYKVMCEELGYDEQDVYKFKQGEKERIQEEYIKQKGEEYLREGTMIAKISQMKQNIRIRKEQNQILNRAKSQKIVNKKGYANEKLSEIPEKKLKKSKSTSKKSIKLQHLTEQQQMLGKLVFQRVRKHLKKQKEGANYFKRVHSQQAIDDALVDFLRVKIRKAEVALK